MNDRVTLKAAEALTSVPVDLIKSAAMEGHIEIKTAAGEEVCSLSQVRNYRAVFINSTGRANDDD